MNGSQFQGVVVYHQGKTKEIRDEHSSLLIQKYLRTASNGGEVEIPDQKKGSLLEETKPYLSFWAQRRRRYQSSPGPARMLHWQAILKRGDGDSRAGVFCCYPTMFLGRRRETGWFARREALNGTTAVGNLVRAGNTCSVYDSLQTSRSLFRDKYARRQRRRH